MSLQAKIDTASGITGFVSRHLGVTPILAAIIKYALLSGVLIGGYHAWESGVIKRAFTQQTIETQEAVIDTLEVAAEDQAEDAEAKSEFSEDAIDREGTALEAQIANQNWRLRQLEKKNEDLRKAVESRPDLRDPWPVSLQRRGGFDLNRPPANASVDPAEVGGGDAGEAGMPRASGDNPGG